MVTTSESAKPAEESPQMRKYLTWLEMSDKPSEDADATIPPPTSVRTVPNVAMPASNPRIPVAGPVKPTPHPNVPAAAPVKPGTNPNMPVLAPARRKKRTGVKIAEAAPVAPTPPMNPPPAAAIDVELVDAPAPVSAGGAVAQTHPVEQARFSRSRRWRRRDAPFLPGLLRRRLSPEPGVLRRLMPGDARIAQLARLADAFSEVD